jgi:serine/threonine-protein kinase
MTRDGPPWSEVGDLVGDLAQLPAAERTARLAAIDDSAVRRAVEKFLDAFDTGGRAFDRPAAAFLATDSPEEPTTDPAVALGTLIGDWRLVRVIGQGGMGTVYEAVREGADFTQRAALKTIRSDLAAGVMVSRFRREREVVARLRHRNIAALIDGGFTADGRPWYAMELVLGDPITRWCDVRRLDPAQRVRLFRQVCAAVHHAHRELIVHRDLKPGNILVTEDGTVKLLDFGIAKLLDPGDPTGSDPTLTAWGGAPATPAYASPEQLAGAPVGVGSDIYSLGVVLYQLLTGSVPFPAERDAVAHRRRVEREPPPPLVRAGNGATLPGRVRRWLAGDIERVVQMALRKEPERRYASAEQLAADLERVVEGRPVVARPDTLAYRVRRLIGRNPAAAMITAALTIGLVVAGIAAIDRARRAERARAAADQAATRATRVTDFLAQVLGAPDPWTGSRDVTVRELLGQASARAAVDFVAEPAVLVSVRLALGRSYRGLGQWDRARRELEQARTLAATTGQRAERFAAERALGEVLAEQEQLGPARAWYDSAAATARAAGDSLGLATVAADLAWLHGLTDQLDSAATQAVLAVSLRRRLGAPPIELANALNNLAVVRLQQGRADSARAAIEEAVALLRAAGPPGEPPLAAALATLGGLVSDEGDLAAADRSYREALALRRKIFGPGHPDEIGTLINLAANAVSEGRFTEGLALADTVVGRIGPGGLPPGHALAAAGRTVRGRALVGLGRFEEAETELRAALTSRRGALPPGHPSLGFTLTALGDALEGLGRRAEARQLVAEAVQILTDAFGADHPRSAAARAQLRRLEGARRGR